MLPARLAPSPPQQPRGEDCLLCSGLPALVLGDVSALAPHGLTAASLTDPVLQALLQGSSKSRVTLFCRRLGAEFTSSQRDLYNPRVQRVSPAPTWGWRDLFSRWNCSPPPKVLLMLILSLSLAQWPSQVFSGDPGLTTVAVLLLLLITGVTVIIWRQPQDLSPLMFRVRWLYVPKVSTLSEWSLHALRSKHSFLDQRRGISKTNGSFADPC